MEITAEEAGFRTARMAEILLDPNMEDALASVGDDYILQLQNSFANSVDPDEQEWEPIVYREVPPPPLVLSGELMDSVLADAQGASITRNTFETDGSVLVDYAAEQQYGMQYSSPRDVSSAAQFARLYQTTVGGFPGRPFIGFGEATLIKAEQHGVDDVNFQLLEVWR